MEFYCIVYYNGKSEYIVSIVISESHILAERKAEENVSLWEGFSVWGVTWLDKAKIEAGEVVFCATT